MMRTLKTSSLAFLILTVLSLSSVIGAEDETQQPEKSKLVIPVFSLNSPVLESPVVQDPFFGSMGAESLKDLVGRFEKARHDDDVEAVILLLGNSAWEVVILLLRSGS